MMRLDTVVETTKPFMEMKLICMAVYGASSYISFSSEASCSQLCHCLMTLFKPLGFSLPLFIYV